jgi:hypothetical protein
VLSVREVHDSGKAVKHCDKINMVATIIVLDCCNTSGPHTELRLVFCLSATHCAIERNVSDLLPASLLLSYGKALRVKSF